MKTLWSRRGALFGFDARITLGVFALLGIVIGLATYSAVTYAHEVSRDNAVKTAMQAFDGYVRDTKQVPTSFDDFFANPTVAGWNGPYIRGNFKQNGDNVWVFDDYTFSIGKGAASEAGAMPQDCSDPSDCFTTIKISSQRDLNGLDDRFDGDGSPSTGTVRIYTNMFSPDSPAVFSAAIFMKGSVKATTDVVVDPGCTGKGCDDGGGVDICAVEICKGGQVWDEDTCACVEDSGGVECQYVEMCIDGETWDEATCSCVSLGGGKGSK